MQLRIITLICLALLGTSCANYDFSRRPVKQGNLLSPARIARLKIGMHKDDVAILMGTSLINPMFNLDRWDYAYTTRVGSGKVQVKHLVLYFHQDVLAEVKQ